MYPPVLGCFELLASNSVAKHGPACTCHALLSMPNITEVLDRIFTVSDRKGRALAWNLISFCPQSCHLLLQLIPTNSPPAHAFMSIFQTALLHTLEQQDKEKKEKKRLRLSRQLIRSQESYRAAQVLLTLQHLAGLVCPLGMHPSVRIHALPR